MAKRNYEALNHQLIEELPHFIQLALRIINHTVTVLFQLQFRFHTAVHTILEQLADQYGPRNEERSFVTSDTIQGSLSQSLSGIAGRLISLSVVPASLAMSLPATAVRGSLRRTSESSSGGGGGGGGWEGEREDSILSTSSEVDMDSSVPEVCVVPFCLTDIVYTHSQKHSKFHVCLCFLPISLVRILVFLHCQLYT